MIAAFVYSLHLLIFFPITCKQDLQEFLPIFRNVQLIVNWAGVDCLTKPTSDLPAERCHRFLGMTLKSRFYHDILEE